MNQMNHKPIQLCQFCSICIPDCFSVLALCVSVLLAPASVSVLAPCGSKTEIRVRVVRPGKT